MIVEKNNGTVTSTKHFLWSGTTLAMESDDSGAKKYFYGEGVYIQNGLTGHYYNASSGLHLALYRAYDSAQGRWLNRDPIAEPGGINLYSSVGNDPVDFLDPYGLVRWGGVFSATAGIIGNSFGLAGGFALGIGTSWTGVGAVAGGVIAVKSGYGNGANILNLIDAVNDRDDSSKGILLNDLAAKAAQTVSMADQYGNVVLEGGATLGPTFSESADASIEVLGGVQAGQTILETAFPNIFGEEGQ